MKKNYSKRSGIACYKKVYWLATIFMLFVSIANAQFTGPYDLSNWTLTNNNPGSDASVNLSGAPNSFIFTGSDSGSGGCCDLYDDFEITVTSTTSINFDYNFSNPDIEQFYYVINGTATHVTFSGSGSLSVPVTAGDTFAFRVYNGDNCCGAGVLTISNFSTGSCSMTASITSQTNVSCNGGSNGSLTVTPSSGTAPYIYSWNDTSSQTTATATNLTAGIYEVTITDDNGCTATVSATITQPSSALSANGVATDVSCNGGNNGTVDLTVVGGTAPYSYAWSNGATTEDLSGLTAGTYNVTVTDANGCTATESVEVQQSAVLSVSGVSTDVSCNGLNNGAIDLTVVGGTPPYTYIWSNTATTEDLSGLEANTYSVTVTDANGCTATESIDIEVNDILAPVPVCQDITVQLDANGEVTISASDIDNGSYDQSIWLNYGDSTTFYSLDTNNQGFGNYVGFVGSTEEQVYFASVNAIDNKVRIGDELKIKYKGSNTGIVDRNIYWRGNANAETDVTWEFSNSRDVYVLEQVGKTNGDLFDPKMPYTIKSTFLINGVEKYLSILGSDVTFTDDNSLKTYYTIDVVSGSLNECSTLSYEIDNSTFDCSMLGANTVTLTVTDTSGNSDSCTATVTVEDNTNPIANCVSPFTIALDATGNASITAADINNGSTDNCGIDTTAIDITDFDCTMIGANQVELTVTDAAGNSSTCTTTVTVVDETNPTANCVDPFSISLDANGNAQISETDINDGSTDNCDVDSVSIDVTDFDCTMLGENDVTLTVTDASGNSSTCTTTVTVVDETNPTANCVAPFTISLDANGNAQISETDINDGSTDNCGVDSVSIDITDFDCTMLGENDVTLTVTDASGNSSTCTTTVTVVDETNPIANCVAPFTISLDANGNAQISETDINDGSTDNCGVDSVSIDITDFDCTMLGANQVELTVTDASGNSSTCITTVTVVDETNPTANCVAPFTISLDANGNAQISESDINDGSTDNCGVDSVSIDVTDFDCTMVGENDVTLTVTDASGNSSTCTTTVTVIDETNPTANCVAPFTISLDANGNAQISDSDINDGSTDNCGVDSVSIDVTDFDCTMLGANQVELTVTDASGNSSTCTTTVTVVDETNPAANCVAPFTISLDTNGNAQISESDINDSSTDNCGVDSVSIDITDFDCTMVGENDVTLTVTDASGNSSTCTTTVTVEDSESPIAMCQDITVSLDDTGNASITAPDIDNGSTDNCAIDSYEIDVDSFDCTMTGMNMVTLTITDTNGNSSTCTSTVTVEDNELPSISCEAITVSLDETGNISILPEDLVTDTFDNCGIENLSLDIDTFDCEDVGTDVEVTIFAQDASGNMTSCTTTVTVIDDLDPVFTCLADQTVIGNVEESYYIVPDFVANSEVSAVDNCDGEMITISQNPPAGSLLEEGEYDFTFVTTDQNGNSAVCISTITVETGDLSVKTPEVSLKSVDLYPNPAENFIIIDNPQHLKLKEMVIYDLNGRKVLTLDLENYTDNTQLNISKLEAAQYFAMIKSTNNGVVVKRILRK